MLRNKGVSGWNVKLEDRPDEFIGLIDQFLRLRSVIGEEFEDNEDTVENVVVLYNDGFKYVAYLDESRNSG